MTRADGLMAFFADIAPEHVEEFRRWHNCEHMEERVSIPGFVRGKRYRGFGDSPTFLMLYETETAAVLGSKPYHDALNAPTPWTREALTWFRNPRRSIYRTLADHGAEHWRATPYLATVRFNVIEAAEDDFLNATAPDMLSRAAADPSIARARLFAVDEPISGMMTSERRIYEGGPGDQKYLAILELLVPLDKVNPASVPTLAAFGAAGAADVFLDRFSVDFALEAPAR